MLIAGCAGRLKAELDSPILVTLQGDDAFLESLPEPFRSQALSQIRRLVADVDGFLVHSRYYADFMQDYFGIPSEKLHRVPLGVDTDGFPSPADTADVAPPIGETSPGPRSIGYLARLSPDKGLHVLVDAFLDIRRQAEMQDVRLRIAGWLGQDHRSYAETQFEKLYTAGLGDAFDYAGVVDRCGKLDFLKEIDVLSVPTIYQEPKGLYVLEALAAGVPVVQPNHGAFPELISATGGGILVPADDASQLSEALQRLLGDEADRHRLGWEGAQSVHTRFNAESMARTTWETCQQFLDRTGDLETR
jgi:glycosyltransferase involved in cell wall biosynthesis